MRAIARTVRRAPSTVSREIRRNLSTQGLCSPPRADREAIPERLNTRPRKRLGYPTPKVRHA